MICLAGSAWFARPPQLQDERPALRATRGSLRPTAEYRAAMPLRVALLAVVLGSLALMAEPEIAVAHAELERASPGPADVVRDAPPELIARFTQNLDANRSSMSLRSADNAVLAEGRVTGPREMRMALPRLGPGMYTVRWTTYSREDAEIARGTYRFRVVAAEPTRPSATAAPTLTATPPASPSNARARGDTTGASALLPILFALAAVGLLGARLVLRR